MILSEAKKGAALTIAGGLCMVSMDVMAKILGQRIPMAQIVWLWFVSQAVLIGGGLVLTGQVICD